MHPAIRKRFSSLKLLSESFWWLQVEFCMILLTVSHQVVHQRFCKLITVNKQDLGFSARKVLNVRYFYVLNVHLGGVFSMKFNVTKNEKVLSKPLYLLID